MTASVSEKAPIEKIEGEDPELLVETDQLETRFGYDSGGVPVYVAVIWVAFLCSYVIYMLYYGLPDLTAWGLP